MVSGLTFDLPAPSPDEPRRHLRILVVEAASPGRTVHDLRQRGYHTIGLVLPGAPRTGSRDADMVVAHTGQLPFGPETFDAVLLLDMLENVQDDQAVLNEIARILRPGGRLVLRVPRAGLTAWLDSFNLYSYLRHLTGRGPIAPETATVGWRRHYGAHDLTDMLGTERFRIRRVTGTGLGLSELLNLVLLLCLRWVWPAERVFRALNPLYLFASAAEGRLPLGPLSTHLTIVAERRGQAHSA